MYLILIYVLVKLFHGTETIDNFFIKILTLMKNKIYPTYKPAEYFNTPQLRKKWWDSLGSEWKIIFQTQLVRTQGPIDDKALELLINDYAIPLDLQNVDNLNGLKHLSNLQHLILYNYNSTDLSGLRHLRKLTKLELYDIDFSDGFPIASIKKIEKLKIASCKLNNTTPFKYLKKLRKLSLSGNNITDISPLAQLNNLEVLSLEDNPITDFTPLSHLKNTKIILGYNQKYDLQQLYNNQINVTIYLPSIDCPPHKKLYCKN